MGSEMCIRDRPSRADAADRERLLQAVRIQHCHARSLTQWWLLIDFCWRDRRPGDYLPPSTTTARDEISAFKTRLNERLAPTGSLSTAHPTANTDWNVFDTLATWWRPNFETFMYPYLPPHVSRPKECKKLYFIQLPVSKVLSVPKNMKLLAVPLFELYATRRGMDHS